LAGIPIEDHSTAASEFSLARNNTA
jgi:hypothetical protein